MSKLAHRLQATCSTLLMAATGALAQNTPEAANLIQQRYESAVAACNSAGLPAPAREACVRDAGTAADRARGGPPAEGLFTTPDGRATIVPPPTDKVQP
ncbi:hypothetical protein RD110_16855 [Rhodoferax koreense]|uniref:Uncharacterized protein n=1 Tax=Rhodoferax koreensis TaxID=1842727 RepID=A0A1P8JY23_9BURK|nr:hypothetical protein [Rhodoferax koreense]APW38664.1 hypothetical protein RD110_16855 [Rhodoferax koreense]